MRFQIPKRELSASVEGSLPPLAEDAQAQDLVSETAKEKRHFSCGLSLPGFQVQQQPHLVCIALTIA